MSQFEYVIVFLSILMALAMAELLAGLGRIIREREHVQIYWVPIAWMVGAILAITQSWWVVWNVRSAEFTNFFEFLTLVLPQAVFFLVAFLMSPPISPGQDFDLRAYYFRQVRWWALLFPFSLLGIAASRIVLGVEEALSPINAMRLAAVGFFVLLGFVKAPRIHEATVFVVSALFMLGIAVNFLGRTLPL